MLRSSKSRSKSRSYSGIEKIEGSISTLIFNDVQQRVAQCWQSYVMAELCYSTNHIRLSNTTRCLALLKLTAYAMVMLILTLTQMFLAAQSEG